MTVNEAHLIYFSPTHTSKQVAEAIVHGTGIKNILPVNVTLQTTGEAVIPASALAIIVVPVYGGRVAPLAMERLQIFVAWIHLLCWLWFMAIVLMKKP